MKSICLPAKTIQTGRSRGKDEDGWASDSKSESKVKKGKSSPKVETKRAIEPKETVSRSAANFSVYAHSLNYRDEEVANVTGMTHLLVPRATSHRDEESMRDAVNLIEEGIERRMADRKSENRR